MRIRRWRSHTHTLIANVIRHRDFDLGQVLLHLLLHHLLHKDPAFALKLPVSAVDDTQNALPQRLLHLPHEAADLVDQLGLDVVSEAAVCLRAGVAVELRVEGVSTENLLKRALELVG